MSVHLSLSLSHTHTHTHSISDSNQREIWIPTPRQRGLLNAPPPAESIFWGIIWTFSNGNSIRLCPPTHREESRCWLAGLLAGFGVEWVAVPCCAPLSLLLVIGCRLMATKLGQSLRSPGSQRKRQHDQNSHCFWSVCLHSDNTHTLSWRKSTQSKETCIVPCTQKEKSKNMESSVLLAALWDCPGHCTTAILTWWFFERNNVYHVISFYFIVLGC